MILIWIIALILTIPTYGISLIIAFIIGAYKMKINDDIEMVKIRYKYANDGIDNIKRDIVREYKKTFNKNSNLSDSQISDLFIKYSTQIVNQLSLSCLTLKEKNSLVSITAFTIITKYFENETYERAEILAKNMFDDWYDKLRYDGYFIV